jgi:mono/diheme cytochrome c family protein
MGKNKENYDRLMLFGLIFSVLLIAGVTVYWVLEPERLVEAAGDLQSERVKHGRTIYQEQCVACHGSQGEGGVGPALNNKTVLKNTLDEVFFSVIRSGVPNTQMPAWSVDYGGPLTDEDVRNVVAYVRAWEPNAPVIEPVVFEPSAERGALLFESTCAICHGQNGKGDKAPAINDSTRLASLDNTWYRDTIKNGRPAKGMPTWGTVLSPNQVDDLLALIDAWRQGSAVEAAFNATDLITSAAFSLEQGDKESALLHVTRAILVSSGPGQEVLRNVQAQLESSDLEGARVTLGMLLRQWPMGDATLGAEIYAKSCSPCHGASGEGGVGKALNPNEFLSSLTNAQVVEFLKAGRPGTAMAGFATRLNEDDLANVTTFLRLWAPANP